MAPSARYHEVRGSAMLVSAWLPYPVASHCIVRSAMTGWSEDTTVENSAVSSPGIVLGSMVARWNPPSATS